MHEQQQPEVTRAMAALAKHAHRMSADQRRAYDLLTLNPGRFETGQLAWLIALCEAVKRTVK